MQDEHSMASFERLRPRHPAALLVAATIPNDHTSAIGPALEGIVIQTMIVHLNSQTLHRRVKRRTLGNRPRAHHPVNLQTQIEMACSGHVLLNDKSTGTHAANRELLVALDLDVLHRDMHDRGTQGAFAQEGDQRIDRCGPTLCVHDDSAVIRVAYPAHRAKLERPVSSCLSKADALDATGYNRTDRAGIELVVGHKDSIQTTR